MYGKKNPETAWKLRTHDVEKSFILLLLILFHYTYNLNRLVHILYGFLCMFGLLTLYIDPHPYIIMCIQRRSNQIDLILVLAFIFFVSFFLFIIILIVVVVFTSCRAKVHGENLYTYIRSMYKAQLRANNTEARFE